MIDKNSPLAQAGRALAFFTLGLILLSVLFVISGVIVLIIGKKQNRNNIIRIGKFILGIGILFSVITLVFWISHL